MPKLSIPVGLQSLLSKTTCFDKCMFVITHPRFRSSEQPNPALWRPFRGAIESTEINIMYALTAIRKLSMEASGKPSSPGPRTSMASLRIWVVATGLNRDFPVRVIGKLGFDCNATIQCKRPFQGLLPKTLLSRDRNAFHLFLLLTPCQVSNSPRSGDQKGQCSDLSVSIGRP